jgi:hypothetical protein
MWFNEIEFYGDPSTWTFVGQVYPEVTNPGAQPGDQKVYDIFLTEGGHQVEIHYNINEFGMISEVKLKLPGTTPIP